MSPTRKGLGPGTGKKNKEIKFNYYDPQAYDDPHQFYQLHKEKAMMDLCGERKSPRRNIVEDFDTSIQTDNTGGMFQFKNDMYFDQDH